MILGMGIDLVDARRLLSSLASSKDAFLKRVVTQGEREVIEKRVAALEKFSEKSSVDEHFALHLAKHFAAKEAFVKALGIGFRDGIHMHDIEIHRNEVGKPFFKITGKTLETLQNMTPLNMQVHLHLSLSDEYPYAQAQVIIEAY